MILTRAVSEGSQGRGSPYGADVPRRSFVVILLALAALVSFAALVVSGWPASLYRHNDFAGFWVGSRMLLDGLDPYDPALFLAAHERIGSLHYAINPPGIGYGYPLTAAVVFAPFALISLDIAAPLWLGVQIALAAVALFALGRALFPGTLRRDVPVLFALAVSCQPAWLLVVGGNVGGYLLAIAASATTCLIRGRPWLGGAIAGLLVVKPHPLFFAVIFILVAVPRAQAVRFAAAGASVGGAIMVASLALRPGWIGEFAGSMRSIGGAPVRRATIFGLLGSELLILATVIVAVGVVAYAVWARRTRPTVAVAIAAAIPLSLVFAPYGWSYDETVLLVTAAVAIGLAADAQAVPRFITLVALASILVVASWGLYAIAFVRGNEALTALVPLGTLATLALAASYRAGRAPTPYPPRHAHA
jgi:glycosyl transferase family 87